MLHSVAFLQYHLIIEERSSSQGDIQPTDQPTNQPTLSNIECLSTLIKENDDTFYLSPCNVVDDVLHDRDLDGGGVGLGQLGHKV